MTRKTKLLKQVSVGCLTLLLTGAPNALAVVTATTQANDVPGQSVIDPESDISEQTTSPDSATSDLVPTPEPDTSDQPLVPESDTHEQPASSQEPLPSNANLPKPQMPQPVKSEVKRTTTSQKKVNPDIPTVSAEKDKSTPSITRTLRGANPKDGTPGLVYNKDYTEVTGYEGEETDVVIPEGVTSISMFAFDLKEGRVRLTSVKFPSSLTSIGYRAFYYNQLTSVMLPSSLTSIGKYAFSGNQLSSVTLPNSLTSIEDWAFSGNQLSSVTLPNSLTSIGEGAFCTNQLSSVTLPDSLTSIGRTAFSYNQLSSVTLPSSLTSIGEDAFCYNQLTSVMLPSSLTSIGKYAFEGNQLTSITVPDSVTEVSDYIVARQSVMMSRVRRTSYTASELGISTHYKTDKLAKLTSQTKGATIDGDSVKLDPNFTGSEFIVKWSAWDNRHTGTLTVKLIDAVGGKITYLDEVGKPLLADKDISSMVTGTFDWMAPEPISDYTVDLERSQILTLSDTGLQTTSLKDKLLLTQTTTPEELIDYLKQQPIAPGTQSVELRYVYTKNPAKKGQVTVKYMDTEGRAVAEDKVLSNIVGTFYITESLEIDGYTLKTIYGKSAGEYTLEPQVVTYVYTKVDKQPVIPTPDNKQPDNKQPDNKTPDSKQADKKDLSDEKTPAKQTDKKKSSDEKLPAKQTRQPTKANQLPKTGESQKSNPVQVLVGIVSVLVSLSLLGLGRKRKHSSNR